MQLLCLGINIMSDFALSRHFEIEQNYFAK